MLEGRKKELRERKIGKCCACEARAAPRREGDKGVGGEGKRAEGERPTSCPPL